MTQNNTAQILCINESKVMNFFTKQRMGLIITDFSIRSGCTAIGFAGPMRSLNTFNSFEDNQNNV